MLLFTSVATSASAASFNDPLDVAALPSLLADRSFLSAISTAGLRRLVAAGGRGHILISDDQGVSWKQSKVPVSTDLVAVAFPTVQQGWAVGHGGVILHTIDGGGSWVRQLDGKRTAALVLAYYQKRMPSTNPALVRAFEEAKRYVEEGATRPLLDVWFQNAEVGYVVGTFNMMLKTVDGGKTWEPWSDRVDNVRSLHLHAMREFGGELYVAGEQGLLLKMDRQQERFVALDSGYQGTFFGLAGNERFVVAYGLRGNAYRSSDHGQSWTKLASNVNSSITSGTVLADGRLVLGTAGGHMLLSKDQGDTFTHVNNTRSLPFFGMVPAGAGVAVVGPTGTRVEPLK